MCPPVGGVLIAIGIYLVTGSASWSMLAIPADLGLLWLILAAPWIVKEYFAFSDSALMDEFCAWRDGHRTTLKLFKNSTAQFQHSTGETSFGFCGTWSRLDNGDYEITGYLDGRRCLLAEENGKLKTTETVAKLAGPAGENLEPTIRLDGLVFERESS